MRLAAGTFSGRGRARAGQMIDRVINLLIGRFIVREIFIVRNLGSRKIGSRKTGSRKAGSRKTGSRKAGSRKAVAHKTVAGKTRRLLSSHDRVRQLPRAQAELRFLHSREFHRVAVLRRGGIPAILQQPIHIVSHG
jgi:hypothetical protein